MVEVFSWGLGLLVFLVVIAVSIALHEAGHMFVSRWMGVPVTRYFVGFGRTVWSKTHKGTEYGVKAIPLGGFVDLQDTRQPEGSPERALLSNVTPWRRQLIFLAGPLVNIVLGVAVLFSFLSIVPQTMAGNTVQKVNTCVENADNCFAAQAGLLPGDKIVNINGQKVEILTDFESALRVGTDNIFQVERGSELLTLNVPTTKTGTIGVQVQVEQRTATPRQAAITIGSIFEKNVFALLQLPAKIPNLYYSLIGKEERDPEGLSSVVGIGRTYGETAATTTLDTTSKVHMLIIYSGLLNIGLGMINLLPFMPLDGGRMLIAFMDSCRMAYSRLFRKKYVPTTFNFVTAMTSVTGAVVIGFMLLVILADIFRPLSVF